MVTLNFDAQRCGKLAAALMLGSTLAACSNMPDLASRNTPFEAAAPASVLTPATVAQDQPATAAAAQLPMTVTAINVTVPRALSVSEANTYYPNGDIVWRGDPIGDRHAQVAQIFDTAFQAGTADMSGSTGVILDVEVVRFHSVTEKTRYSVGGVHNMVFKLTVRRASTGAALAPTRLVEANLPALGGRAAIEADRNGQTQKVRVTDYLSQAIRHELARFVTA
ncbi:DUF6778 family protein [Sulfitobacter geojensis]|uniref:DUF6778 family protein n=1 Tax=Sulfitobacter geojensis TaxID=1342299 RepID=UPI00249315E0|nr:DUF6778 family protein [Sulfitobacter geojensis]